MKSTDSETGETELIMNRFLNPETGEIIRECRTSCTKKTKFQIPKSYLHPRLAANSQSEREQKCCLLATKETYTLTRKEKVINLQEEIIIGANKTSHRMFLIPTLIFSLQIVALIITIVEIVLHTWAHRKNSKAGNASPYYYRSPLHLLTSQFCAVCRQSSEMEKVGRLHDEELKHVTRTMG